MTLNTQQKIETLVIPILDRMGYKLWGCQCEFKQKQGLVRIFIDKPEGILLSDCEQVSHAVSAAIDVEDCIPFQYRLEISSPGLPKPLFYPWQYHENNGAVVKVKLIRALEGKRWLKGVIRVVNNDDFSLEQEGNVVQIAWTNISKAFIDNE